MTNPLQTARATSTKLLLLLLVVASANTCRANMEDSEILCVFAGDQLQVLREKLGLEKWKLKDVALSARLVDQGKGLNVVIFKAKMKDGKVGAVEVWGVPTGTHGPTLIKTLKSDDEDFSKVKGLAELPS